MVASATSIKKSPFNRKVTHLHHQQRQNEEMGKEEGRFAQSGRAPKGWMGKDWICCHSDNICLFSRLVFYGPSSDESGQLSRNVETRNQVRDGRPLVRVDPVAKPPTQNSLFDSDRCHFSNFKCGPLCWGLLDWAFAQPRLDGQSLRTPKLKPLVCRKKKWAHK